MGKKAGFEFADSDLHAVLEKLLDRRASAGTVIPEFLSSQSWLDTAQLGQVVGGASAGVGLVALSPRCSAWPASLRDLMPEHPVPSLLS